MYYPLLKSIFIVIYISIITIQGTCQSDNSKSLKDLINRDGVIVLPKTKNYDDYIQNNKLGMMIITGVRKIIGKDIVAYAFEPIIQHKELHTDNNPFSGPEVIIEVDYSLNLKQREGSATIIMQVISNHTNKMIASDIYTSNTLLTTDKELLISKALADFEKKYYSILKLKSYYEDIVKNGKEIILEVEIDDKSPINFGSEFNKIPLSNILDNWISKHSKNGRFNSAPTGPKKIGYNAYINVIEDDKIITAFNWAKFLQKHLKNTYNIQSKMSSINGKNKFLIKII